MNIQSRQRLLINGATVGNSSALIQFVKQYNVKITATCNTKKLKLIKSFGLIKFTITPRKISRSVKKNMISYLMPLVKVHLKNLNHY